MASQAGIYVHVPYCLSKCTYCGFNSYPTGCGVPDGYVEAVVRQAERDTQRWRGVRFTSIYFGGGTPCLLTVSQLGRIVEALERSYDIVDGPEFTLEANPNAVPPGVLDGFRGCGVNRLSVGVQTTNPEELALLGRTHTRRQAIETLEMARSAGLAGVSADVIVGIPGQTEASLCATVHDVIGRVDHVSVYLLSVEAGTELARMVGAGEVRLPNDEEVLALYGYVEEALGRDGFERYEISNWCIQGKACLHNKVYWDRGDYAGLGAGAHSHHDGIRYSTEHLPSAYIAAILGGRDGIEMQEILTDEQILLEKIMLGLRTAAGIDPAELTGLCGPGGARLASLLDKLQQAGYLSRKGRSLQLTPSGIRVHDSICEALAGVVMPPCNAFQ